MRKTLGTRRMVKPLIACAITLLAISCILPQSLTLFADTKLTNTTPKSTSSDSLADTGGAGNSIRSGTFAPAIVEQQGAATYTTGWLSTRTDTQPTPNVDVPLVVGKPTNQFSADCQGGYFLVGPDGTADFGSPVGTISLWIEWDSSAPNGRFWGQDYDFETRWTTNQLVLDWGSDTTLTGIKDNWVQGHWYFIAITWDENANSLAIYWGDNETLPIVDISTTTWTASVVGFHAQTNNIMNSAGRDTQVDGRVDDFRYFNIQRTEQQIQSDYLTRLSGNEAGLQDYYQFERSLADSVGAMDLAPVGSYRFSTDVVPSSNPWVSNQVDVAVRNLQRLYCLNGTFDTGVVGTNADWSGDGTYYPDGWRARREAVYTQGVQRAAYLDTGRVTMEDEGYTVQPPLRYRHYDGTSIYWYQTVDNSDQESNFLLSLDYMYDRGPIGTSYSGIFSLGIEILVGGTVIWSWSIDTTSISERGVWFSLSPVAVNLASAPSSFEIRAFLTVNTFGAYVDISSTSSDLDGNPENGQFVTAQVDNVSLVKANAPSPEEVNLTATLPYVGTLQVHGQSGTGLLLANYSYWRSPEIPLSISTSVPASFEFEAKTGRMLRWSNSCETYDLSEQGVAYSVGYGTSANLSLCTYVGPHPEVEDFALNITYPLDWTNATVFNVFSSDVTSSVVTTEGGVYMEGTILGDFGWWRVVLQSPNYLEELQPQQYDTSLHTWRNSTLYAADSRARVLVTLGSSDAIVTSPQDLELRWIQPNASTWSSDNVNGGASGRAVSNTICFGALNASTGIWNIEAYWNNETAVAYGVRNFEIQHASELMSVKSQVSAILGDTAVASVMFTDADTGEYILNSHSVLACNWSGQVISLAPNFAKSSWEADLNTSLVGVGNFTVVVNASSEYYTSANCSFIVSVTSVGILKNLGDQITNIGLGGVYNAKLRFEHLDGSGIENTDISVVSYTGHAGGLSWTPSVPVISETGNYSIAFTGVTAGTYDITVKASKAGFTTVTISFYLLVGEISSEMEILNGSSGIVSYGDSYALFIQYTNSTGWPLASANVSIASVVPEAGLTPSPTEYMGNGTYKILLQLETSGTFSILVSGMLQNYESQFSMFTLTVIPIPSILAIGSDTASVAIDRNYTVRFSLKDENLVGIGGSEILVFSVTPSTGVSFSEPLDYGNGTYSMNIMPSGVDTFDIIFRSIYPGYQNGTCVLTLVVTEVPTSLRTVDGATSGSTHYETQLQIVLFYQRTDSSENISGATISISSVEGLSYIIAEDSGVYIVNITSKTLGEWSLLIKASRSNYRNSTIVYDITVMGIGTSLTGEGPPSVLQYAHMYWFSLRFNDSMDQGIESASVTIPQNPLSGVTWSEIGQGYYNFSMRFTSIGVYTLSISVSKFGYSSCERSFTIQVQEINTNLTCASLPPVFYESREYVLSLYLCALDEPVENASLETSLNIRDFVTGSSMGGGWYNLTLTPSECHLDATVKLSKEGYSIQEFDFLLLTKKIALNPNWKSLVNSTYSMTENTMFNLTLTLSANDTGSPIANALVSYTIIAGQAVDGRVVEAGEFLLHNGVYSAAIRTPEAGLYVLNISIRGIHLEPTFYVIIIDSQLNVQAVWASVATVGIGVSALLFMGSVVLYYGQREYRKKQRERMAELASMRNRINDANNIIGVMIIHRTIGLPVYSKILKGGFEESMVSAFITAVTQFRSELQSDTHLWKAIPVSEIITVVPTENLICALLTVSAPSDIQIANLEGLAVDVGTRFDSTPDMLREISTLTETSKSHASSFDTLMEDYLDEALLAKYCGLVIEKISRDLKPLEQLSEFLDSDEGITPGMMIAQLRMLGIEELSAYRMVLRGVEEGAFLRCASGSPEE